MASGAYYDICPLECGCPHQNEINMHLYLHQFVSGPNHPNRNQEYLITPGYPNGFGNTLVNDWKITTTGNPNDRIIARAQGMHLQAGQVSVRWYTSLNIVFDDDRFNGSTLQVMGIIPADARTEGEWSVIGGTGEFTMAQGRIKHKLDQISSTSEDYVRELHIYAVYSTADTDAQAAHGPAFVANTTRQL